MTIKYVGLEVSITEVSFKTNEELEAYIQNIENLLLEYHPAGFSNILSNEVEVTIVKTIDGPKEHSEKETKKEPVQLDMWL